MTYEVDNMESVMKKYGIAIKHLEGERELDKQQIRRLELNIDEVSRQLNGTMDVLEIAFDCLDQDFGRIKQLETDVAKQHEEIIRHREVFVKLETEVFRHHEIIDSWIDEENEEDEEEKETDFRVEWKEQDEE